MRNEHRAVGNVIVRIDSRIRASREIDQHGHGGCYCIHHKAQHKVTTTTVNDDDIS